MATERTQRDRQWDKTAPLTLRPARVLLMSREAQLEVAPHVRPLGGKNAEDHRVACRAVTPRLMVAQDTVLSGTEPGDRAL